jgi:CheY-like chemotaxis protein
MKILIVDDDESLRRLMELVFQEMLGDEYKILLAEDGEEAIRIVINEENIKLVVTDFNMPKKNGIELAEFIRQCCNKIKIIIISNESSLYIQNEARKVSNKFLFKTEFLNYTSVEKQRETIFGLLN